MGNITINITSAGAVDREFFDIASPPFPHLGSLWANFWLLALLWGALGLPWSPLWPSQAPLGCPLAAFGRPLGPLWANFGRLSLLWGALGLPLGCLGSLWGALGQLGRLRGPHRRPMALKYRAWRQNQASGNLPADPADPGEVVARSAVRSPTSTRAGGQDDVSFTNSLK